MATWNCFCQISKKYVMVFWVVAAYSDVLG